MQQQMSATPQVEAAFGTLNVHRADCHGKHEHPCDPWPERLPRLLRVLSRMRCSVYAFQECLPEQARDLTIGLGWGTARNPAWWSDENFNVVAMDRAKWVDVEVHEVSLWQKVGDTGDRNRRSVNWIKTRHIQSGVDVWFGSGHFETGDPPARILQAQRLVETWPDEPAVLGVDRNSFTTAKGAPRDLLLRAGIKEAPLTHPRNERSFHGWDSPEPHRDGKSIDGIHYTNVVPISSRLESTVGSNATDHSGGVLHFTAQKVSSAA